MKKSLRITALFAAILFVFTIVGGAIAESFKIVPAKGEYDGKLVIIHTNDSHGRIMEDGRSMGMSAVKYIADEYKAEGAEVLILDAGDTVHGLPIVNVTQGAPAIDVMNHVGYDYMCPGNHDFNYGYEHLLELAEDADFPILAANVTYEENGEAIFPANDIIEIGGYKLGIFGLATPETKTKTNPNNVIGVDFGDDRLAEIAQEQCDYLKAQGVDSIICLAHLGDNESSAPYRSTDIVNAVTDIDLFVDGHSHTLLNGHDMPQHIVNETLVVSSGEYLEHIGVVVYDGENYTAELKYYEDYCNEIPPEEEGGEPTYEFYAKDPEITALVQQYYDAMMEQYAEVVGHTDVLLNGEREFVRTQETNLGDLAADAILAAAPEADIAINNGGGIRANIEIGDITRYDLLTVFPFGNTVATVEVTGADLLYILEAATFSCPESSGAFPQVAGISFEIHTYAPYEGEYAAPTNPGGRVRNVMVGDEPLDLEKTYVLATNDFLAAGGDTYALLTENYANSGMLIGVNLEDALANYIQTITDNCASYAEPAGRIKIVSEEPNPEPPETGFVSLAIFGTAAIMAGAGVVLFRKK